MHRSGAHQAGGFTGGHAPALLLALSAKHSRAVAVLWMVRGQLAAAGHRPGKMRWSCCSPQAMCARQRQQRQQQRLRQQVKRRQPDERASGDLRCRLSTAPACDCKGRPTPQRATAGGDPHPSMPLQGEAHIHPPHLNLVSPSTMRRTADPKWKLISSSPTTSPQSSTVSCSRPAGGPAAVQVSSGPSGHGRQADGQQEQQRKRNLSRSAAAAAIRSRYSKRHPPATRLS